MKQLIVISVMSVAIALPLIAQHQHDGHSASAPTPATSCSAPSLGPVPESVLRRELALRPSLGKVHELVSTKSADAQSFYDQGLAYVHGYVWIEAARSFHQALRIDSKLAMAHAGLARVYINLKDLPAAQRHADAALSLAAEVTPAEKLRIDAELTHVAAARSLSDRELLERYRDALDAALAADLDNPEVWLLRGNAEESAATGIGQQGRVATIPYYEAAMKRAPDHPAPYHYLVHTYENLGRFHDAAVQGERYATLSPAVPHALHMYGHDLMKTGRIPAAIDYFTRADSQERSYYDNESIAPELDWHHAHNLALLGMSHRYLGQTKKAESLFREIAALKPYLPQYAFMYNTDLLSLLLASGKNAEVLNIVRKAKRLTALDAAFNAIAEGRAYVQMGRLEEARRAHERAMAEMPEVATMFPEWPGFAEFLTRSFADLLEGQILYSERATRDAGREKLRGFVKTVRHAFTGPDQWIAGLYEIEQIARIAVTRDDREFAREMVEQLEAHDPAYPGTFFTRALLAEKERDRTSRDLFARAADGWKVADAGFADAAVARSKR